MCRDPRRPKALAVDDGKMFFQAKSRHLAQTMPGDMVVAFVVDGGRRDSAPCGDVG